MTGCIVIAEAGVNHNGSLETAKALVDAAKQAGADIVKFQAFTPSEMVTADAGMAPYQKQRLSAAGQRAMLERLALGAQDFAALSDHCRVTGIAFLATPFDITDARMLETLGVSQFKIASGELTNAPLLHYIATTGKPAFLSCGMASEGEIRQAIGVLSHGYHLRRLPMKPWAFALARLLFGRRIPVTLLHCVSAYPVPQEQANLPRIARLRKRFHLPTGYSDHTTGTHAAIAAAALGASVIEKHLTLDTRQAGPDHAISLTPAAFADMVHGIRETRKAMQAYDGLATAEKENIAFARKSLVARRAIRTGERFTRDNIAIKRPAGGPSPFAYWQWLERRATRDYKEDEHL